MKHLKMCCPRCGKRVTAATFYCVATINVKRTCPRCRARWSVTIKPLKVAELKAIHKLEWTRLVGGREPFIP